MAAPLAAVEELSYSLEEESENRQTDKPDASQQKLGFRTSASDGSAAHIDGPSDVFVATDHDSQASSRNHVVLFHMKPHNRSDVQTFVMPPVRTSSCLSGESSGLFCRICHEGEGREDLISPCKCTGTMGLIHLSCVERWLSQAGTSKCEICGFEYITKKSPRPLTHWLKSPAQPNDRRNFYGDLACFMLLTPLAAVSTWLCITGAIHYSQFEKAKWETAGLITLAVFLMLIYCVWCMVASRYHMKVIRDWKMANQIVRIIPQSELPDENNNSATRHEENVANIPIFSNEETLTFPSASPYRRFPSVSDSPIAASSPLHDNDPLFINETPRESACRHCVARGPARRIWFPPDHRQSFGLANQPSTSSSADRYQPRFQANRCGSLSRVSGKRVKCQRLRSSLSESAAVDVPGPSTTAMPEVLQPVRETYV